MTACHLVFFMIVPGSAFTFVAPPPQPVPFISTEDVTTCITCIPSTSRQRTENPLTVGIQNFLLPPANAEEPTTTTTAPTRPPNDSEIKLLRQALSAFYNERDATKAEPLLTQALQAWDTTVQPPDERSALRAVRAKCYMFLGRPTEALGDYNACIQLLEEAKVLAKEKEDELDPPPVPSASDQADAYLGRARAAQSLLAKKQPSSTTASTEQAIQDYQRAIELLAGPDDEWDANDPDDLQDRRASGAQKNPYATYEWASALRDAGAYKQAYQIHHLADESFAAVGDAARAVISGLDAGIDLAAAASGKGETVKAEETLQQAIGRTTKVEGRDVGLLQRVIAKEGEARVVLASLLWGEKKDRSQAEAELGEACIRLEQLEADSASRGKSTTAAGADEGGDVVVQGGMGFNNIDDVAGAGEVTCSRLKNEEFLKERLGWPEGLRQKVKKLQTLQS